MNSCTTPLVIVDEEGRIVEANSSFWDIFSSGNEFEGELRNRSIFSFLDQTAGDEIRKILRQRSMVGNFTFSGSLVVNEKQIKSKFKVSYYCDEYDSKREVMININPLPKYTIEPPDLIRYLGEMLLPHVPMTSQIIGINKKVIYSINWNDLPLPLRDISQEERICCYLLRKGKKSGECVCDRVIKEGKTSIEEVYIEKGAEQIWAVFVVVPIYGEDNSVYGVLSTVNNVTEERKLAKGVEEYLNVLRDSSMDSQLLPVLIRHLNEPISYILGSLGLLMEDVSLEKSKILAKIKQKCEEYKEIINRVSSFSGEVSDSFLTTEINALVRSMVLPVFSKSGDKKVVFRFSHAPFYISCSPSQFAQALIEIIKNGYRYAKREVLVSLECKEDELFITVDDDGEGVSPELSSRIFVPFFTTEKISGHLGLGLSLAKSIVDSMGGTISVGRSALGGASFTIRLPIVEKISMGDIVKQRNSILIVEDDEDLVEILRTSLEKEGFCVYTSVDCEKAKEIILSVPISYIILDLLYSDNPTGIQFYEEITQKLKFPKDKIVIITGDTASPFTRNFLKKISSPFLEKPFDMEDLKLLISRVVEG
ncbi:MAG: ATP-binding protein [Candidatus Hydrogenedentes bacterium]|nr:ATP-binding protein [Candidatus Hydrogenedentota bacterium]